MASVPRKNLARSGDAHSLPRQIFQTDASTYTVRLHHLKQQAAHDKAIQHLLDERNATQSVFPATSLTLVYKPGSDPRRAAKLTHPGHSAAAAKARQGMALSSPPAAGGWVTFGVHTGANSRARRTVRLISPNSD